MSSKIKVYELAKELGQDSQHLVDVIQRLGVDIKNPMSVLGSEEVRSVREYYRKQKTLSKATAPAATKNPVTEKRVGATVIRRRAKPTADKSAAEATEVAAETAVETFSETGGEQSQPEEYSEASASETQ